MSAQPLGRYLTLEEFCTCTQTYQRFAAQIDPFPKNLEETSTALEALCQHIIDPVIDRFGRDRFLLTYGFCYLAHPHYWAPFILIGNGL